MSRLHAYAQLLRLPMLPSALSNVCLAALVAGALPGRWLPVLLILPASACLYLAGMVWNDWFDLEQDRRERPDRPLPSGRVGTREASALGALLTAGGVLFAALAGLAGGDWVTTTVPAVLLVGAVFLYDGWAKRTPLGPAAMGLCRFLNVLLGLSASGSLAAPVGPQLACVVGLYVAGVTWFARTEARASERGALVGAAVIVLAALLLALALPASLKPGTASPLFPYLLVAFACALGLPAYRAVNAPTPTHVQAAVTRMLFGLIVLDAILATAVVGTLGLVLLLWLTPALYLKRRRTLYAT